METQAQSVYGRTLQEASRAGIGSCIHVALDGAYLYAIQNNEYENSRLPEDNGEGCLYILTCADPSRPQVVGKLSGLGNARQITVSDHLALVTSRDNGMFVIDVADPTHPQLLAHYNTLEHATGITRYGSLAFVTCRQYGVEIIDITDPRNPRHLSKIGVGEAQSVDVCDGFMYAGVWGGSQVVVCDIRNPAEPKIVSRMELDGYGDGVYVQDGICYAATGHTARGMKVRSLADPAYARGSGLEIFDVRDPYNPRLLSRLKLNGRYHVHIYDMWGVQVSGRYAYMAHTFNGVFVIDVSDPEHPAFVAHKDFPIPRGDHNYRNIMGTLGRGKTDNNEVQIPFNPEERVNSPVGGLAVGKDYIYAACGYSDLHTLHAPDLAMPLQDEKVRKKLANGGPIAIVHRDNDPDAALSAMLPGLKTYRPQGQVFAVVQADSLFYAACGSAGIHVVDLSGQPVCVAQYATEGFATDIKQLGNVLYVAEGNGGLTIWHVEHERLQLVSRYKAEKRSICQVMVSDDGRYVVLHVGGLNIQIVDVSNIAAPRYTMTDSYPPGLLYARQLCSGMAEGRYAGCYWHTKTIKWCDLSGDVPVRMPWTQDCLKPADGLVVTSHGVLAINSGGYIVFDPRFDGEFDDLVQCKVPGVRLTGKPTVSGHYLFVANRAYGDVAILDISSIYEPKLVKAFKLTGNPDLITCSEGRVIIPAGNQGMFVFQLE